MSTFQERLDKAAGSTTCQILQAAGQSLVGFGAWNLAAGGAGIIPITLGGAALLASNYGCTWDSDGTSTLPGGSTNIVPGSCLQTEGCDLLLRDKDGLQWAGSRVKQLLYIVNDGFYPNETPRVRYSYINCDDEVVTNYDSANRMPVSTAVAEGGVCVGEPAPSPEPTFPPYEYVEPGEGGCSLTVNVLGFGQNADGTVAPIYKIEPSASDVRAGGGIIGGCNFEPVVYYQPKPEGGGPGGGGPGGGGGEPPYTIPFVDGGPEDDPEWLKLLKQALATAAGNLLADALKSLFESDFEGVTYTMPAPCDVDEQGNPLEWTGEIPAQKYQPAVLDRLDALSSQLTQHLQWKTPICEPEKPELRGSWVTTRWISDEKMDHSGKRLRKLFRYRSESTRDLGQLSAYWQDFTWTAGEVCVFHKGAWWGTPQIWAASEEEGQRVIRFAAAEAGLDPDQVGEWGTSSSRSPRYGMSGTMRIQRYKGFPWVAQRSGPDFPNTLALQLHP